MFENKKKEKQQKVTKWMLNGKDMLIYLIVGFMTLYVIDAIIQKLSQCFSKLYSSYRDVKVNQISLTIQ